MMKIAILLALAVAVSAGGYGGGYSGGCFLEEEMTCVKKNAVMCGSDWCFGHCSVDIAKKCDTKVWFKTVCDEVDFCKEIRTPCGHDGDDEAGLFCSFNEDCLVDKKCKLVPADKKSSYGGHWHAKSMPGGFFEMCKDTYSCGVFDPWALDASEVEVTCTKEYEIVEDMSCESLFAYESWFGKGGITESKFMMMNSGFKCGKHLVGKVVCVEADIAVKAVECGGSLCEEGFECATKETCEDVAVEKPVCLKEPVYSCLKEGSFESTICGNQICGPSEKCEIIANKVCPSETIVVPGPQVIPGAPQVIPGAPQVIPGAPQVIPGAPQVIPAAPQVIPAAPQVIPGTPTVIPGTPTVVPGAPVTPVTPATPAAPATPPAEPAPPVPLASVVSQSLSDALGTVTYTDAVANGGNAYTGGYSTGDYGFSRSDSGAFDDGTAVAYTDVDATLGYEAQADSFATSNPGPPSPPATP